MQSVIRFLQAEWNNAAQVHRRLCAVHGDTVMSDGSEVRGLVYFKIFELKTFLGFFLNALR